MEYILDSQSVRYIEKNTIEKSGLPGILLMEEAGTLVANIMLSSMIKDGQKIAVFAGKGNNGGDGLVIARHLLEKDNLSIDIYLVVDGFKKSFVIDGLRKLERLENKVSEDNYAMLSYIVRRKHSIVVLGEDYEDVINKKVDLLVDSIFGIGINRDVKGIYKDVIDFINKVSSQNKAMKVISIDLPSGLNSDNAEVMATAVRASHTFTFNYKKPCHVIYPGTKYCGQVEVVNINFDLRYLDELVKKQKVYTAFDEHDAIGDLLPARYDDSNKGTYGKLCVFAGCSDMPGAALLCTEAVYRLGTGYVCLSSDEKVTDMLATRLPEAVINNDYNSINLNAYNAFLVGPGLSKSDAAINKLKYIVGNCKNSTASFVFDADAINILADILTESGVVEANDRIKMLNKMLPEKSILTPHKKELSRLLNIDMKKLESLYDVACILKNLTKHTFILKDARSIVVSKNKLHFNVSGNNGLSVAGSGDVLAGIVGGYLAQHYDCHDAAIKATYVHGYIGSLAAMDKNVASIIPSDLIDQLKMLK